MCWILCVVHNYQGVACNWKVYLDCDVKNGLKPMHVAAERHGNAEGRVQVAAR